MRLIGAGGRLASIFRKYAWLMPLVAGLGVVAGLLEGIGIGLLIPLIAVLLADAIPASLPGPIHQMAMATGALDAQTRIFALGAAMMGFILAKGVIQAANNILIAAIDGRIGRDMRNALCDKLLALDYPFFLRNERARLVQIISNDCWFASDAVRAALNIVPAAVTLLVFGVLLAWLNWRLSLVVAAGALIIEGALLLIERRQRRLSLNVNAITHRLGERMLAVAGAMRTIRVFGQQSSELVKFAAAAEGVRRGSFGIQRVSVAVRPLVEVMISGVFVIVLLVAYDRGVSIPEITAYLVLLSRTQPYAQIIGRSRVDIAALSGSLRQMEWLLAQEPSPASLLGDAPVAVIDRPIRFEQVSYTYPDGSPAVHDVTLALEPGTATALIGKSGAGKTTLINLLCRLAEPSSGILFHGEEPLADIDPALWRRRIAIAGQDTDLLDGTVAENIAYARPEATEEEIEAAARAAGAAEFIANLPAGYATRLGLEGLNLSGGQRQRIGLARALLRHPDLLILDEATSAVDAISEAEIMTLLKEHRYFRTALVISHRRSTLSACQQGIVIRDGRIVETGPLRELSYYGHDLSVETPSVTIIVPTFQRREVVCDAVRAIARMEYAGPLQLIVVVDGATDGSAGALETLACPFPKRVIVQANAGAATARNRGAGEATGDILLFLDDDMMARPDLVAEHVRTHASGAEVVLGHLPLDPASPPGPLSVAIGKWAEARARELSRREPTMLDFLSGHFSIRREVFTALRGFDEHFTAGGTYGNEDLDFGLRVMERYRVAFNERAIADQRYVVSPQRHMQQYFETGRADVAFARKHPRHANAIFAERGGESWRARFLFRPLASLGWLVALCRKLGIWSALRAPDTGSPMRSLAARMFFFSRSLVYWSGVRAAGGRPRSGRALVLCYHALQTFRPIRSSPTTACPRGRSPANSTGCSGAASTSFLRTSSRPFSKGRANCRRERRC